MAHHVLPYYGTVPVPDAMAGQCDPYYADVLWVVSLLAYLPLTDHYPTPCAEVG